MFKLEQKYVVFSIKDAQQALNEGEQDVLNLLLLKMQTYRKDRGKQPIDAIVIDKHALGQEAYDATLKILEKAVIDRAN